MSLGGVVDNSTACVLRSGESPSGRTILGISADYHDAAASVISGGRLVVAAEEERFSRRKHDPDLPVRAMAWCLEAAGIGHGDLEAVAFSGKPLATYERILMTHSEVGAAGFTTLATALRAWAGRKLWVASRVEHALRRLGHPMPSMIFAEHHQGHAASAFYPSPFDRAAVLVVDGVGEWASTTLARGSSSGLDMLEEQSFPNSLGLFFSTMTAQCGFAVNDGEYKLMGLAPYGAPRFVESLLEHVIRINDDGSVLLDQRYFGFRAGRRMGSPRLDRLLGSPARPPDRPLDQHDADVARSTQVILGRAMVALARHAHEVTGEPYLCLAGGVALNCVANTELVEHGPFEQVWVQPAAGDGGGSAGAAWWAWHQVLGQERTVETPDGMSGAALGPSYGDDEIADFLAANDVPFEVLPSAAERDRRVAGELAAGRLVGWFVGAMEFGPRALGHRSILADPRDPTIAERVNRGVKERESFRPFAPSILVDHACAWFELSSESPYMLFAPALRPERRIESPAIANTAFERRLAARRSEVPAVTHVDHTSRVQTVDVSRHPEFHALISAFYERTGCPMLLNTSFNGRDEPIVRSPADALRTFLATGLDLLVLERCLVRRDRLVDA